MANETTITRSSYEVCSASAAMGTGAYSTGSRTAIASITGITGTAKDYPQLDFQLNITGETILTGEVVNLYRIASDGTAAELAPTSTYAGHYVGSFILDVATVTTGTAYLYGVENIDQNDTFIWENGSAATLTASLEVRTRALVPGA